MRYSILRQLKEAADVRAAFLMVPSRVTKHEDQIVLFY
jgi:hypothetical protein